jgi:hypothetical protein
MCSGAGDASSGGQDWYQTRSEEELLAYQRPVNRPVYDGDGNHAFYISESGETVYRYEDNPDYGVQLQEYEAAQIELQRRALVKEREAAAASRQAQLVDAQQRQQAELQRQATMQQQAEQARLAQEQQIGQERVATQAMSQSMRVLGTSTQAMSQSMQVLGTSTKSSKAPTAQMTKGGRSRSQVRPTAGSQSLRIGSSVAASGAGLNIGG